MRKLFVFSLSKNVETEEIQVTKVDGKEVKTLVKVNKPEVHNYFLIKPGRTLSEAAEMEYGRVFWKCQKEGILPMSQIQKRLNDDNGVLSKEEIKWRDESYEKFWLKQAEYQALNKKTNRTDEEEKQVKSLLNEIGDIWTDLQQFEQKKTGDIYQNTAESVAKGRQTLFWAAHLAYEDLGDGKSKPVFGDGSYEDKLKVYDSYNEGDDVFNTDLAQRIFFCASIWNYGKGETQEDFEIAIKTAENQGIIKAVEMLTDKAELIEKETNKDIEPTSPLEVAKPEIVPAKDSAIETK